MQQFKKIKLRLIWVLVLSVPLFITALYLLRFSRQLQFQTVIAAALLYLIVALLHHLKDRTLSWEVVVEYLLIAALVLIILQSLLF